MGYTFNIQNGIVRMPQWRMAEPLNFQLRDDEHLAIVGPNGGGKSMFVDILTGAHPLLPTATLDIRPTNIKYITFRDSYGAYDNTYYLQQRWNQAEIEEDTPTVAEELEHAFHVSGDDTPERRALQQHLYDLFSIRYLLDKYIILLSSGETRKFQLIKALLSRPSVLIMDNPFIGLDASTRDQLSDLLTTLSNESNLQIILVLTRTDAIPSFINKVVKVENLTIKEFTTLSSPQGGEVESLDSSTINHPFDRLRTGATINHQPSTINPHPSPLTPHPSPLNHKPSTINHQPSNITPQPSPSVISMNNVTIRYGARTILRDLNWTVLQGEHWAIEGENGSGKSTLLSLVCADNPQSYACDISLFGHQRGSGESIWDIKRHIGYVSPEMHRAYQKDLPVIRIVASGLQDSIGLYVTPKSSDYDTCRQWLRTFGIEHLADRTFLKISSGEQRLVLLARAFVKSPDLLILDEPLHGLDDHNRALTKQIIEAYSTQIDKTLIMVTHYKEELPPCIDHRLTLRRQ